MAQHYQLKVKDALDENWSEWFDGLTITHDADGNTILDGAVRDQTALYGLVAKLRDLGLVLIAIEQRTMVMETTPATLPEASATSATDPCIIGGHTHDR